MNCFSGYFFEKQSWQGRFFIFIQSKNGCGDFFLKLGIFIKSCACTVISSNIIQVWP